VGNGFVYLPETIEMITETVAALPDGFTVGDFRDALGITRKHAVPLLEWLDDQGVTRRVGDGREVRR
jgi:selenocysteine-specific elongation factor